MTTCDTLTFDQMNVTEQNEYLKQQLAEATAIIDGYVQAEIKRNAAQAPAPVAPNEPMAEPDKRLAHALQHAKVAVQFIVDGAKARPDLMCGYWDDACTHAEIAVKDLEAIVAKERAAIPAAPVAPSEPVAWRWWGKLDLGWNYTSIKPANKLADYKPLYAAPIQPRQAEPRRWSADAVRDLLNLHSLPGIDLAKLQSIAERLNHYHGEPRQAPSDHVTVRTDAVDWLKKHYPALCEISGLCERVGGKLYTRTFREPDATRQAPSDALTKAVEALEAARNGLAWYQDACPELWDGSDDEMIEQIDAAILSTQGGN